MNNYDEHYDFLHRIGAADHMMLVVFYRLCTGYAEGLCKVLNRTLTNRVSIEDVVLGYIGINEGKNWDNFLDTSV